MYVVFLPIIISRDDTLLFVPNQLSIRQFRPNLIVSLAIHYLTDNMIGHPLNTKSLLSSTSALRQFHPNVTISLAIHYLTDNMIGQLYCHLLQTPRHFYFPHINMTLLCVHTKPYPISFTKSTYKHSN